MKAIYVFDEPTDELFRCRLYADSSIGRAVVPLFVPDLPYATHGRVCPVFRVGRLGKGVTERFAMRYIDAIGAACLVWPDKPECAAFRDFERTGLVSLTDSMVTTGHWIAADAEAQVRFAVGETLVDCDGWQQTVAAGLSRISRYATIKSGDIIIPGKWAVDIPFVDRAYINAYVNDRQVLNLKVKS